MFGLPRWEESKQCLVLLKVSICNSIKHMVLGEGSRDSDKTNDVRLQRTLLYCQSKSIFLKTCLQEAIFGFCLFVCLLACLLCLFSKSAEKSSVLVELLELSNMTVPGGFNIQGSLPSELFA